MLPAFRFLILAAILTASQAATPAVARPLRILTYNIHHAEGRDGVYDLQRIADVINAANPDLVSLQEVDQGTNRSGPGHRQIDMLAQLTGMPGRFGTAMNRYGGQVGNGVLVNPEFELLRVTNHAMPNPEDSLDRSVMEVQLRFDDDGASRRIDFFATHLDHAKPANRNAQTTFINDLVRESNTPAILAGDFNFHEDTPAYNKLTREWVDPTAANPGRPSQIDYVAYRGADQWSVVQQGRFIVNSTTADASDHYPLFAVLELVPHSADFDGDGDVDGADMLSWQRNLGANGVGKTGDANVDRVVNAADLTIWQQQFGATAPAAQAAVAIPEPAGNLLLAMQFAAVTTLTTRQRLLARARCFEQVIPEMAPAPSDSIAQLVVSFSVSTYS